jgi:hypothetical protein
MAEKKPLLIERLDTDRTIGILVTIGGMAAVYYYIIRQAIAATRHDPTVFLSLKGVMFSPVVLIIGVVYTVYGSRVADSLGSNKRPTRTGWFLIILFWLADMLLYWWLKRFIHGYGYEFSY